MRKRLTLALALGSASALALSACGGGSSSAGTAVAPSNPAEASGAITVLTQRTDLVQSGKFKDYVAEFNKIYPKIKVTIQGITDYEGEVKIRMNSSNYGDVLLIPGALPKGDYPKFFEPLGSSDELSKKYRYTNFTTVAGKVYGLALNGNANGLVYNKAVWRQAGITSYPKTPAEFIADLKAIKTKTGAIPYYTNYHDGWPLTSWYQALGSATCDKGANASLAKDTTPWSTGRDLNAVDSLLFNVVHEKLVEPDPTTTNWENSKSLLGTGKTATMWLGSWAVSQMQEAAKKAGKSADDIGFMPFPMQVGGAFCSVTAPDYNQAVSIHSANKAAARAWLDWFTEKSGYAVNEGSIPTTIAGTMPATLKDYTQAGVTYIELDQTQAALVNSIDNAAEVGLSKPDYRQHLVDVARGAAPGSLDTIFADLNKKWADGIKTAGQ